LAIAAAWLLWNASLNLLLLAVGERGWAAAKYSIPSWGSRNRTYEVRYDFRVGGTEYRGSGSASRSVAAGSRVPVRFLNFAPMANAVDSTGTLLFHAGISVVAGLCLAVYARRRLR
jgi:hypothetical protein